MSDLSDCAERYMLAVKREAHDRWVELNNAGKALTTATETAKLIPTVASETEAAGAIIDIMSGGKLDWRARLDESDFLESADWQTALAYARAVLATTSLSSKEAK